MMSRRSISWSSCERCGAASSGWIRKTKISTAAVSATQATTASVSISAATKLMVTAKVIAIRRGQPSILLHIALDLTARLFQHLGGNPWPGSRRHRHALPPLAHNHQDQGQTDGKRHGRDRVVQPVEAPGGRRGQRRFAVLLHESLQDGAVGFPARHALVHFLELGFGYLAGTGKCRPGMAARSRRIAAAARAHQLLAQHARAIGGWHRSLREQRHSGHGRGQREKTTADSPIPYSRDAGGLVPLCRPRRYPPTLRAVGQTWANHGRRSVATGPARVTAPARSEMVPRWCAAAAGAGGLDPAPGTGHA